MTLTEPSSADSQLTVEDRARAIRDRLRDAIVDRRLGPGVKLVESEVGELFDASRTIARSALQMLSFEGLVRIERNRGAFVASPTPKEARQLFTARRLIEPGIVEAACARITPKDVERLKAHLADERRHMNQHGPNARRAEIRASGDFHLTLAEIADNAILKRFMDELIARSSLVIALYGRSGASSCGHGEHEVIVQAVAMGDGAKAQALVLHHIDHIEADLDLRDNTVLDLRDALQL